MDNEDRADLAALALGAFRDRAYTMTCGETDQTVFGDLLCDMRHLADRLGLDWDKLMSGVASNYKAEIEESVPATFRPNTEYADDPHYAVKQPAAA